MRKITILALTLLIATPVVAQDENTDDASSLWDQVVTLYEQAKDAGETVTEDVYEWAENDLQSIGDWEYRVEYLANPNHLALEKKLNEYGVDRWEVVWIDRQGPNLIVTMKRSSRTWLNKLPLGDLLKMVAPGVDDGGGE